MLDHTKSLKSDIEDIGFTGKSVVNVQVDDKTEIPYQLLEHSQVL